MAEARTILLASDLSARSDRPTDRAFALAAQMEASVLLLHVVEGTTDAEQIEARAQDAFAAVADYAPGFAEYMVVRGHVQDEILKLAGTRNPAMIVTGPARYNHVRDFILGTTVDALVRQSPVPVLVVKQRVRGAYQRLLVATDFSPGAAQALETAAALFPDADITAWHVCHAAYDAYLNAEDEVIDMQRAADANMARFVAEANLSDGARAKVKTLVEIGAPVNLAETTLRHGKYDLMVVGTRQRSGLAQAIFGSWATVLLEGVRSDVLVVRGLTP